MVAPLEPRFCIFDEVVERRVRWVVIVAQAETANHGSEIKAQGGPNKDVALRT